jgi:Tol biopolymer transport system component
MNATRRQLGTNAGRAVLGAGAVAALASCTVPTAVAPRRHSYLYRVLNGYRRDLIVTDGNGRNVTSIVQGVFGRASWGQGGTSIAIARGAADDSLGTWAIWLVRPDGRSLHRLTSPPSGVADTDPTFSPDGQVIAFTRDTIGFGYGQGIWLVRVNGTGLHFVPGAAGGMTPSFSSDGKFIVYAALDGIHRIATAGGPSVRLVPATHGFQYTQPCWSPDGKRVVFIRHDSATTASVCYVAAAGGGTINTLTSAPVGIECPGWSRDSATVTYACFDGVGSEGRRSTTVYRQAVGGPAKIAFRPAGPPATDLAIYG